MDIKLLSGVHSYSNSVPAANLNVRTPLIAHNFDRHWAMIKGVLQLVAKDRLECMNEFL